MSIDAEKEEENEVVRFRASKAFIKRLDRVAKRKTVKRPDIVKIALIEFFEREDVA